MIRKPLTKTAVIIALALASIAWCAATAPAHYTCLGVAQLCLPRDQHRPRCKSKPTGGSLLPPRRHIDQHGRCRRGRHGHVDVR